VELTPDVVEAWIRALLARGLAANTVRKLTYLLGRFTRYAVDAGAIDVDPVSRIDRRVLPSARPRDRGRSASEVLTPSQVRRLLEDDGIPLDRRILWALLLFTGMRYGEAAALRWRAYQPELEPLGEIVVRESWDCIDHELKPTKTGLVRRVPVHPELAEWLRLSRAHFLVRANRRPRADDLVAPHWLKGAPKHWHERTALRRWKMDLARQNLKDLPGGPRRLHATRHTFISLCLRAGASRDALQTVTHAPMSDGRSAFDLYSHYDWAALCRAVAVLGLPQTKSGPTGDGSSRRASRKSNP